MKNLSFRLKLLIVLVSAIAGLSVILAVAYNGLRLQGLTNEQVQRLTLVSEQLNSLAVNALRFRQALHELDDETLPDYLQTLSAQQAELSTLRGRDIRRLEGSGAVEQLEAYYAYYDRFLTLSQDVARLNQEVGFSRTAGLRGQVAEIGDKFHIPVVAFSMARDNLNALRDAELDVVQNASADNQRQFKERYDAFHADLQSIAVTHRFGEVIPEYLAAIERAIEINTARETSRNALIDQLTQLDDTQHKLNQAMSQLTNDARLRADQSSTQAIVTLIAVGLAVGLTVMLVTIWITVSVRTTLKEITEDLGKIKAGDLTARLPINHKRNDEFDTLSEAVNGMAEGLVSLVSDVVRSANSTARMIDELNREISSLNQNNQLVNQQIDSVAGSTEEISATITSVASTTHDLNEKAEQTYHAATDGAATLNEALGSLRETGCVVRDIHEKLKKLGDLSSDIDSVIGMINGLASQTNLLALNAAIEAARAGEAGRGFAVVADEVRTLAERTVDATSRITDIVDSIQNSTGAALNTMVEAQKHLEGVEKHSERAGEAMHGIESRAKASAGSAEQMSQLIGGVSTAARQISEDMDHVAQRVRHDSGSIGTIARNAEQVVALLAELNQKAGTFVVK